MIAEGESDELEFKSTLRWDLKEGIVSKKLEEVVGCQELSWGGNVYRSDDESANCGLGIAF